MKVRLHPKATSEYFAAAAYYESYRAGLGYDFTVEVEKHLATLIETCHTWPIWPGTPADLRLQRYRLHRFPYAIAYRVEGDAILVYAIAAYKRRPGYWLSRVD